MERYLLYKQEVEPEYYFRYAQALKAEGNYEKQTNLWIFS